MFMRDKDKTSIDFAKRSAFLLSAPVAFWRNGDLERELLSQFYDILRDKPEQSHLLQGWYEDLAPVYEVDTIGELLTVCARQSWDPPSLYFGFLKESLPEQEFMAISRRLGYRTAPKQRMLQRWLHGEYADTAYQSGLVTVGDQLIESCTDPVSKTIIPTECVLFCLYQLRQQMDSLGDCYVGTDALARELGCSEESAALHAEFLVDSNLASLRIGDNENSMELAIEDLGAKTVEQMREEGRGWFHPGVIAERYVTQRYNGDAEAFARETCLPIMRVKNILRGEQDVNQEEAAALESVTQRPAQFWLTLQALHNRTKNK